MSLPPYIYWLLSFVVVALAFVFLSPQLLRWQRRKELARATQEFKVRRESLEAKFFTLATSIGKPRGLRWTNCDWKPPVRFVRDRSTGMLTALVSVEIHFEAIEGGGMEDVAAVGDVRDASAVFHYEDGSWGTGGKALFNMNPETAVDKLEHQFEAMPV